MHTSFTTPVCSKNYHDSSSYPPSHPKFFESHITICSGDNTTPATLPWLCTHSLSVRAEVAENAQHDPQSNCERTEPTQLPPYVAVGPAQLKAAGIVASSPLKTSSMCYSLGCICAPRYFFNSSVVLPENSS